MIYNMNVGTFEEFMTPIIDDNYPQNVNKTIIGTETTNIVFNIEILEQGNPASYTYQWYLNGSAVSGANSSVYTISNVSSAMTGNVYCEIANDAGTVTSRIATFNITHLYTPILDSSYPQDVSKTIVGSETTNVTFEAKIKNEGNPSNYTYQWYADNEEIVGATSSSYIMSNISSALSKQIYCKVTNDVGTVQTRTAVLNITHHYTPVLNSEYPQDVSKTIIGTNATSATFNVEIATAGNPASYTYQWYLNGSAVSGATNSSYTVSNISSAGTYAVYCKVINAAGTVQTRTATLNVIHHYVPILDSGYPANVNKTVVKGSTTSATFEARVSTAGNPNSYTYQWYVNNSAVSGATSSSYTKSDLSVTATYNVYCKVTNAAGTVQTRTAVLSVTQYYTPVLTSTLPSDISKTVIRGNSTNATFSVSIATDGVPNSYTYQWYLNSSAVSGATNSSYTVSNLTTTGTHKIYCKVTNAAGSVNSRTATLTVTQYYTPVLNGSYPADASTTYKAGSTASATFSVSIATAGNPNSYTYQWYVNNSAVSGATSSSYTKSGMNSVATYTVYCKVTNAAGSVNSRTATLTVNKFDNTPQFTYSGSYALVDDNDNPISSTEGNWKIRFLTSGNLKFNSMQGVSNKIDVFLVGGGGNGGTGGMTKYDGGGGGGGYTNTYRGVSVGTSAYEIVVGGAGGATSAFGYSASGGMPGSTTTPDAGDGGSGGGAGSDALCGYASPPPSGGVDGANGEARTGNESHGIAGTGQGRTTREFAESGATLYSRGGDGTLYTGSGPWTLGVGGGENTGNGGVGGTGQNIAGGSGIVIIRNKR